MSKKKKRKFDRAYRQAIREGKPHAIALQLAYAAA